MNNTLSNPLDLRGLTPSEAKSSLESRSATVEPGGSFWVLCDHDPIELYQDFIEIGFIAQTFIYPPEGYRVHLGRIDSKNSFHT